jgi:hypothetical protein
MPNHQSAQAETDRVLKAVQESGEVKAEIKDVLQPAAKVVFEHTFGPSTSDAERSGDPACYRAGCLVRVVYRDQCTVMAANRALSETPAAPINRWPGAIYATPSVPAGGDQHQAVTWALLLSEPLRKVEGKQRADLEALVKLPTPPRPTLKLEGCGRADVPVSDKPTTLLAPVAGPPANGEVSSNSNPSSNPTRAK